MLLLLLLFVDVAAAAVDDAAVVDNFDDDDVSAPVVVAAVIVAALFFVDNDFDVSARLLLSFVDVDHDAVAVVNVDAVAAASVVVDVVVGAAPEVVYVDDASAVDFTIQQFDSLNLVYTHTIESNYPFDKPGTSQIGLYRSSSSNFLPLKADTFCSNRPQRLGFHRSLAYETCS